MIYLVGCDHIRHQTFNPKLGDLLSGQADFKSFLWNAIQDRAVDLVAEELDCEYPQRTGRESVALSLVNELKITRAIEHQYCDPCPSKRAELGIGTGLPELDDPFDPTLKQLIRTKQEAHLHEIAHRWPIREKFWIESLGGDIHREVIFICGALHRITFGERLRARGARTTVLSKFFRCKAGLLKSNICEHEFGAYRHFRRHGFPPENGCPCVASQN